MSPHNTLPVAPSSTPSSSFIFFNDTATPEIYTLSLHDALPISSDPGTPNRRVPRRSAWRASQAASARSEEHTSELQSQSNLVCRLLLEKKKKKRITLLSYKKKNIN